MDLDCFSDYSQSDILATYFACRATSNEDTILSTVGMPAHSFQLTLNPLPPSFSSFSRGRHHITASARLTEIEKFYSLRETSRHADPTSFISRRVIANSSRFLHTTKAQAQHRNVSQLVSDALDPSPCPDVGVCDGCVYVPGQLQFVIHQLKFFSRLR